MKVLVTGGAGFVGFHVTKALLERGDEVIVVDNFNEYYSSKLKRDRIRSLGDHSKLRIIRADISNYTELVYIFWKYQPEKVCHLAAQAGVRYSIDHPWEYQKNNSDGFLNLLETMRLFSVKDLVFASSSSVYGERKSKFYEKDRTDTPESLYAATKKANELYAHAYHKLFGFNCTGLRFFTVYGPWGRPDMVYWKFVEKTLNGESIELYNKGKMERDFTYIDDIVSGILAAIDHPYSYEIINLGNDKPVQIMYLIWIIEKLTKLKVLKDLKPKQLGDVKQTCASITKAKRLLGYQPKISIEEGMTRFVEWYKGYVL